MQRGAEPIRDPAIDLVRCICLALVVVGHAMMVSPVLHPDGTFVLHNTLTTPARNTSPGVRADGSEF